MAITDESSRDVDRVCHALLLLGPTGSGKSPLGDYLNVHGLHGQRCLHFDFGAALRAAAAAGGFDGKWLNAAERAIVSRVLAEGSLLEDNEFCVAQSLLRGFVAEKSISERDLLVLNGLPRHEGQVRDMASHVHIGMVVELRCSPQVVAVRIRRNTGGDRTHRVDDSPRAVEDKLRLFDKATAPLLDYYRARGTRVVTLEVTEHTQPEDLVRQLPPGG